MADTYIVDCISIPDIDSISVVVGNITRYVCRKIGRDSYTISDVVVYDGISYRLFTVALAIGFNLYKYVNSGGRSNRMDNVRFTFSVRPYKQMIIDYRAIDMGEWIGDILERERLQASEVQPNV